MKRIKIDGAELAYRDEGSGKTIVFLHAFPLNQTMWDEQIEALSSEYRVVTFDWRGFGQSSLGEGISSIDVFADDLARLLKGLHIDGAVICGLSMGGYAAFAFYRKYSEFVSALILADTKSPADTEDGKRGRYEMADLTRSKGPSALVDVMTPRLIGETSSRNNRIIAERVKEMIESAQSEGIAQALVAMANRPDSDDLLSRIACPALIIVGKEDKLTPPAEAEKMHKLLPHSSIETIQDAGHLPNLEQPESFNRVVKEFLAKI